MVLVEGLDLAGSDIKPQHGAGIKIVAGMPGAGPGRGIADTPIDRLRIWVIIPGHPGRAAAGFPVIPLPSFMTGLALAGNGEGAPQLLAVVGVEGNDISAHAELAARAADDDLAVDHERHQGEILPLLVILHLGIPEYLSGLGVECDDMIVRGREEHLVLPK